MQSCPARQVLQDSSRMTGSNPMSPGSNGELSPFDLSGEMGDTAPCSPTYDATDTSQHDTSGQRWDGHTEIAEQAKHEAEIENRIAELRKEGFWTPRRLSKFPEPSRPKVLWDYLCEEMQWLSADFAQERRWKRGVARKVVRMVVRHHEDLKQKEERARREEQAKLKRIATSIAKEVRQFWSNVEKVVQFKQQSRLEERRKKALDLQLDFIVGQTEKYSDLLSQSLSEALPASKTSSSCIGSSQGGSLGTSPTPSMCQGNDGDFLPHDEEDDEETIEIEEQQYGEDAESQRLEIEMLKRESELPLEELLQNIAPKFLQDQDGEQDMQEPMSNNQPAQSIDEDDEFTANEEEAEDEEDTIAAEEALDGQQDHSEELSQLAREGEMSLEELLKKYSLEKPNEDTDDESSEGQESGSSDCDASDHDSEGVEFLVKSEDESCTDPTQLESSEPKKEITDIAATAESLQPKGYTLATTQVKTEVPFLLHGDLREYQHIGLEWLVTMFEKKLNGILADEMGLGKTIQTISLLAHLACERGNWGPHLIIVPTSVILNWEMELKRWCPSFKILTYYGSQKERKNKRQGWTKVNAFHVCITSYKLVLQDHQAFRRKNWKYLILDEAQNIKNFKSQRWQSLLNFNSQRRLLLTGTPLQNSLMELWSLMHFLMPHVFQSHREFKEWFSNPLTGMIEGSQEYNEGLIRRLHKVLRPFLLRRIKQDVEKQMPKKYEHVIYCRLSKRQRYLYDDFMAQAATRETLASGHFMSVINILMQLRKVCNHPNLFDPRPIHSPFITSGICYSIPSLVLHALQLHPLEHVDLSMFDLINLEGRMSRYGSEVILPQYKPSRSLIQEIADSPEPPPRPRPVKMKVNRMLQPVCKPDPRTVVVMNSSRPVQRSPDLPPSALPASMSPTPPAVPTLSPSAPSTGTVGSVPHVPPVSVVPMVQPSSGSVPVASVAPGTGKPVQLQTPQPGYSAPQRLILTPDMQARLPTGEVISLSQLASLTARPVQSPAVSKPLTLQLQGAKFTLSGTQVRQVGMNQPRPLQGNVLHLVSSGGQHHLLSQPAQLALIQALAQQSAAPSAPQLVQGGGSAQLGVQTLSLQSLPHSLLTNANISAPTTPGNPLPVQAPAPGVVKIVVRQAAREVPTSSQRPPVAPQLQLPQTQARPLLRVLPGSRAGIASVVASSAITLTQSPVLMVSSPALASRLPSPALQSTVPASAEGTPPNASSVPGVALRLLATGTSSALQLTNHHSSPPPTQNPALPNCPISQTLNAVLNNCPTSLAQNPALRTSPPSQTHSSTSCQTLNHNCTIIHRIPIPDTSPVLGTMNEDTQMSSSIPNGNGLANTVPQSPILRETPDSLTTQSQTPLLPTLCLPGTNPDPALYVNPLLSLAPNPPSPPILSPPNYTTVTAASILPKLAPPTYNFSLVPALLTNNASSPAPMLAAAGYNSVPTRFLSSPLSLLTLSPLSTTNSGTTSILYTPPSAAPVPSLAFSESTQIPLVSASVPSASVAPLTAPACVTVSSVAASVRMSSQTAPVPSQLAPVPSLAVPAAIPVPSLAPPVSSPLSTSEFSPLLTHVSAPLTAAGYSPLIAHGSAAMPLLTASGFGPLEAPLPSSLSSLVAPVSGPLTDQGSASLPSLVASVSNPLPTLPVTASVLMPSMAAPSSSPLLVASLPPFSVSTPLTCITSSSSLNPPVPVSLSLLAPPTSSSTMSSFASPVSGPLLSLTSSVLGPLPSLAPNASSSLPCIPPPVSGSLTSMAPPVPGLLSSSLASGFGPKSSIAPQVSAPLTSLVASTPFPLPSLVASGPAPLPSLVPSGTAPLPSLTPLVRGAVPSSPITSLVASTTIPLMVTPATATPVPSLVDPKSTLLASFGTSDRTNALLSSVTVPMPPVTISISTTQDACKVSTPPSTPLAGSLPAPPEPPLSLTVAGPSAVSVTLSTAPEAELVLEGDGFRSTNFPFMRPRRQPPPPPRSPFYLEPLEERRRKQKVERLERVFCLNETRCNLKPVYGTEVIQICTLPQLDTSSPTLQDLWVQTSALRECIFTPQQRLEQLAPLIERFIFAMPPVEAPQISQHTSHPPPSMLLQESVFKETLCRELAPHVRGLHRIVSNMRTQFPDLRLIQYDCGKLQTLDRLLRQLKSGGHRVLLFTQMTRMLDVLEQFLTYHGHIYLRLDGSTRVEQRQVLMERFNMDKRIFCFILSTRSGGVGVNLTGADTVIFYDSDWNPTMDAQAQDRCHRIGQTRDVHIYRLVSERTVEENILKKAQQKRMLGDMAIEGGNFTTAYFKQHSIRELFDMEDASRKDGETQAASPDHTEEDSSATPHTNILEQALCDAEDEEDTLAASLVRAEQVADLAEFNENAPLEPEEEEQSRAEQEINALVEQLTPIERYAMNYLEASMEDVSREELKQAEEQVEAARKDLFLAKDDGGQFPEERWEEEGKKSRKSRPPPTSRQPAERVGLRTSERLRIGRASESADFQESPIMPEITVPEPEILLSDTSQFTPTEITSEELQDHPLIAESTSSTDFQLETIPVSPPPTILSLESSIDVVFPKQEEIAEEPVLCEEESVPVPTAETNLSSPSSCMDKEVSVPRTPRRKVTADCEILLAGAGDTSPTAKVLRRLPGRLITVVHERPSIPRRHSRGRGPRQSTDNGTQSPNVSDPHSPTPDLQSEDNSETGSPPPKRKRGRPPKTRADMSPLGVHNDFAPVGTSPLGASPEMGSSPLGASPDGGSFSLGVTAPWSPGSCYRLNSENESGSPNEKRKRGRPPKRREGSVTSPDGKQPPGEPSENLPSPLDTAGTDCLPVPIDFGSDHRKDCPAVTLIPCNATAGVIPNPPSNIPQTSGCGEGASSSGADEPPTPPKRKRGRPPKSQNLLKGVSSSHICNDRGDSSPDRSPSPQVTRTPLCKKKWQLTADHCEVGEHTSPAADTDSSGDEETSLRTPLTRSARTRLQSHQVPLESTPTPAPKSHRGRSPSGTSLPERPSTKRRKPPSVSSPSPPSSSPHGSSSERPVGGSKKRHCPPVERVLRSSLTASPASNTRSSRPSTLPTSPSSHRGRKAKT
ncbi:helicase SRCAP isoform 2-T3 [Discoglossus pictus]